MALISCYDDAHGDTVWVVERSNGSSDGRKRFSSYEEAELYMNCLKSIEDREQGLVQQQQIIDNQQKLIELQQNQQRRPQVTRQVLDPQYEEWLRFKKATDPAFVRWKAEEDKKKSIKEEEEKAERLKRQNEADRSYLELKMRDVLFHEHNLQKYMDVYNRVATLYLEALRVSFTSSSKIEYRTEDGYDDLQFNGGIMVEQYDYGQYLKNSYEDVKRLLGEIPNIDAYIQDLKHLSKSGNRKEFDIKIQKISNLDNRLSNFYTYFSEVTLKIIKQYRSLSPSNFSPYGLVARLKVNNVVNSYLRDNEHNIKAIENIHKRLVELLKNCNVVVHVYA